MRKFADVVSKLWMNPTMPDIEKALVSAFNEGVEAAASEIDGAKFSTRRGNQMRALKLKDPS